jgi:hypothetical protein
LFSARWTQHRPDHGWGAVSGTPEGVGPLEAGDRVQAEIDAVGELQFQVV